MCHWQVISSILSADSAVRARHSMPQLIVCSLTLHEDEDVQRIVVLTQRLRDEAVVVRVHHRGVQNAVDVHCTNSIQLADAYLSVCVGDEATAAVALAMTGQAAVLGKRWSTSGGIAGQHSRMPVSLSSSYFTFEPLQSGVSWSDTLTCVRGLQLAEQGRRRSLPGNLDDCIHNVGCIIPQ
jgi:hypothetical protein